MTKSELAHSIPWTGVVAGLGAAICYTLANAFLRKLSTETDFIVVVFMKAATTTCIFLPWLCHIASKGKRVLPQGKYLWVLLFGAVQTQIFGNCGHQIALGIVGMAIAVPIYMGTLVASSAVLGRVFLNEGVKPTVAISLAVLVVSVMLLSVGGEAAGKSIRAEQKLFLANLPFVIGIVAAIGTGLAFAVLSICIRYVLRSGVPTQTPLVFVGMAGAVGFGIVMLMREGPGVIEHHSPRSWAMMLSAGICNATAFLCLSWSLKLLPVVYVNAINVSQVAMAAAIGILLFSEPLSVWLSTGLMVMVVGFGLLAHFSSRRRSTPLDDASPLTSEERAI